MEGSKNIARLIADLIHKKQASNQKYVLSLATGFAPKALYAELVRLHREERLSFKKRHHF